MPTNIAVPSANAHDLGIVCVWTVVGLMLTTFFTVGLAAQLGQAFADVGQALAIAG
jgi:hypothetical protein